MMKLDLDRSMTLAPENGRTWTVEKLFKVAKFVDYIADELLIVMVQSLGYVHIVLLADGERHSSLKQNSLRCEGYTLNEALPETV